jgi:hypothetical protein
MTKMLPRSEGRGLELKKRKNKKRSREEGSTKKKS